MRHIYVAILLITLIGSVAGCHRQPSTDPRIAQVEEILNRIDPPADSALNMLDCIAEPLSSRDRALKAMLTVKANDKAYRPLTSDSLILTALDYFERHPSDSLPLAESLYYGGRVAVSMGDYPAALAYFRRALAHLPASPSTLRLKGLILYHTAFTFNKLRLNKEAIPYLKQSLEIDRALNNPSDEISDLLKLGFTYTTDNSFTEAEYFYRQAASKSMNTNQHLAAHAKIGLAYAKFREEQIDSALYYIRDAVDSVSHANRRNALAVASQIYKAAGIYDTAYIYAKQLLSYPKTDNRHVAYRVLLSEPLQKYSSKDTLVRYVTELAQICETRLQSNKIELVSNQENFYRYSSLHDSEVDSLNKRLAFWRALCIGSVCVGLLAVLFVYLYYRNKTSFIQNNTTVQLASLENEIDNVKTDVKSIIDSAEKSLPSQSSNENQLLSKKLAASVLKTLEMSPYPLPSSKILNSPLKLTLSDYSREGKTLTESSTIWENIEEVVLTCYPSFKSQLDLLTSYSITKNEWQFALLVKMGFSSSEIKDILSKSRGAINSRGSTLLKRMVELRDSNYSIAQILHALE